MRIIFIRFLLRLHGAIFAKECDARTSFRMANEDVARPRTCAVCVCVCLLAFPQRDWTEAGHTALTAGTSTHTQAQANILIKTLTHRQTEVWHVQHINFQVTDVSLIYLLRWRQLCPCDHNHVCPSATASAWYCSAQPSPVQPNSYLASNSKFRKRLGVHFSYRQKHPTLYRFY